eukprot:jgi/Tetstr1/430521/TSEL_020320.t1
MVPNVLAVALLSPHRPGAFPSVGPCEPSDRPDSARGAEARLLVHASLHRLPGSGGERPRRDTHAARQRRGRMGAAAYKAAVTIIC